MKFLVVVTPPSICHGCSTQKTFWEEKFIGKKQYLFVSLEMKTVVSAMLGNIKISRIVMSVSL